MTIEQTPSIAPTERDAYLSSLPADVTAAMQRIYRWAENSPNVHDKLAVDRVFTFVAEQRKQLGQVEGRYSALHDEYTNATGYEPEVAW